MNVLAQKSILAIGDWALVLKPEGINKEASWGMGGKFVKITSTDFKGPDGETLLTHVKLDGIFLYFFPEELQKVPDSEVPSEIKARALWGPRIGIYGIYKPTIQLVPSTHGCFFLGCKNLAVREVIFNDNGTAFICYGCQNCFELNHGILCEGRDIKPSIPGYKTESGLVTFKREPGQTNDVKNLFRSAGVY